MKTIKVYMNVDGSLQNGFTPDFNLNQYSWQDSLINVYVPVSICDFDTGSTGVVCLFKSYDSEGELDEDISTNSYSFAYVKRGIYKSGDTTEYALYERTMPKQMTLYSGEQAICFNVNIYDSDNAITSIITSGDYTYTVVASSVKEESEESSDYDTLYAMYNTLEENVSALEEEKQDTADSSIEVYTDSSHSTTTQSVVYGLNYLNERTTNLETQVDTNTSDIAEIKESAILQETYLGTTTQEAEPTSTTLTTIGVELKGSALENGDVILWVYSQEDATDTIYRCIYSNSNGWSWYAIPDTEVASNTSMGLIQGTNTDDDTGVLKVDIVSGKVNNIYYYDTYEATYKTLNASVSLLNEIVTNWYNGTTAVPKATADDEGNDIVDTYMTKNLGATKDYVKNYALVKAFNDVNYLDFSSNTISTTLVESESAVSLSSIGSTSLGTLMYVNSTYEYTLSQSNQLTGKLYYYTDVDMEDFTLTVNVVFHSSATDTTGTNVATYTSDTLSVSAGNIQAFTYSTNCALLGSETIDVVDGSYFTFEYVVNTTSDTATTFTMFTSETYPSLNQWAIAFGTVSFASGVVGEEETHAITTYTLSDNVATYSLGDEYILSANTEHYFELTYTSDFTSDTEIVLAIGDTTYPLVSKTNTYSSNATLGDLQDCKTYNGDTELYVLRFKAFYRNENDNAYFVVDNAYLQDIRDNLEEIEENVATNTSNISTNATNIEANTTLINDTNNVDTDDTNYKEVVLTNAKEGLNLVSNALSSYSLTQSGNLYLRIWENPFASLISQTTATSSATSLTNTFTISESMKVRMQFGSDSGTNASFAEDLEAGTYTISVQVNISDSVMTVSNIMLNEGSTAYPYQEYNASKHITNNEAVKLSEVYTKTCNLLDLEDVSETTTNGITYSISNGVITLNGTATANMDLRFDYATYSSGTYTLKVFGSSAFGNCSIYDSISSSYVVGSITINNVSSSFATSSSFNGAFNIYITSGTTFSNATASPMLVKGSTAPTEFVEYDKEIYASDLEDLETQVETNTNNISTNTTNIANLDTRLTTAEEDIDTLEDSVATNTSDIATNKTNISTNATNIATNASDIDSLENRMSTAESDIDSLESSVSTNASNISTNTTDITNLTSRVSANESNIDDLLNATAIHLYAHHIHISCTATLGGELYMTLLSTSDTAFTYTTLCEKLYAIATGVIVSGEGIANSDDTTLTHISCIYEEDDVLYVRYQTAKNTHKNASWTSTYTTIEDIPETLY